MSVAGRFVTVEGPNGVGKSTIVAEVCLQLQEREYPVLHTKELTPRFVRSNEESCRGYDLALLIAEDRAYHLQEEILPALAGGKIVVCDRYIETSLVCQGMDGVPQVAIWELNCHFLVPDLSIHLIASADVLGERLAQRKTLTRFEREATPSDELIFYQTARDFLQLHGFNITVIDNGSRSSAETVGSVISAILALK